MAAMIGASREFDEFTTSARATTVYRRGFFFCTLPKKERA
jgi:hypothetical protein